MSKPIFRPLSLGHPRYLKRGARPSSSGFGEAFASTGAEPECTKSSTLDEVHGGLRPEPKARERRRRSERTTVLEHRSTAKTKPKPEIGGRPDPLRYRRWSLGPLRAGQGWTQGPLQRGLNVVRWASRTEAGSRCCAGGEVDSRCRGAAPGECTARGAG